MIEQIHMKDNHIFVIGNETCSDLVQYVKPNKLELTCKSMRSDAEYLSSDMESNLKAILVQNKSIEEGEGFHAQKQDISWQHVK